MKKTITILSALAMTTSPALALNVVSHKTQNFQNILKPSKSKSNVTNYISTYLATSDYFYFQARLSTSTYNGFPAFMNQIKVEGYLPVYFFQWLDDNNFSTTWWPDLSQHTQHGLFNDPFTWSNRLDQHMGHFGCWLTGLSQTAHSMLHGRNSTCLTTFINSAEAGYNQAVKAGNVTGIDLNFGFTFDVSSNYKRKEYTVKEPNYVILTS